jgi:hypothetical protein
MSLELPEKDRELVRGVIDLHVHATPDIFARPYDEVELARQAADVGYRAILFKSHAAINADRIYYVRKMVPGIAIFGGIVLNYTVGGINPEAVEAALCWGAKEVWMPNIHSKNHIEVMGVASYPFLKRITGDRWVNRDIKGIYILDSDGNVIPEVYEILDLVGNAGVMLGTAHLSPKETFALVKAAKERGLEKIVVTHPESKMVALSDEDQVKLADMGAIMEHCCSCFMPMNRRYDPHLMAESIKKVGAERCVMATDLGQLHAVHPIDGMRQFMEIMMDCGISEKEIEVMAKQNPTWLLGLN